MLKVERVSVMNLENAIRGARNPMNSWDRMDSHYDEKGNYILGENDLGLATRLAHAGSDHRKFLRQIFVSVDITAPLYWWKEFDTYKVGTVANSTSTMHKIHAKAFSRDDFSCDRMDEGGLAMLDAIIAYLAFAFAHAGNSTQTAFSKKKIAPDKKWKTNRVKKAHPHPSNKGKALFGLRCILEKSPANATPVKASR